MLLAVLFVPVRYQLQGMWKEDKWASVKVSWLLSVISFKGAYEMEKGLTGSLRVLWFKLWTMGDESAEKIEEAEETAEKEGFDKINFTGSFYTDEEYPGCPYCGAKKCFVCGNCGKVSCYDGSDKVVCNWCGSNGTAADDDGKLDVSGGGF